MFHLDSTIIGGLSQISPILKASQNPIWEQEWRGEKRREAGGKKHLSP